MTIDELEGRALAETVALALGMTKAELSVSGDAWFDVKGNMWIIADKEPGLFGLYRPDLDRDQAWKLVEKMQYDGYYLDPLRRVSSGWVARFIHEDGEGLPWVAGFIGYGLTVPVAICRAFLVWASRS